MFQLRKYFINDYIHHNDINYKLVKNKVLIEEYYKHLILSHIILNINILMLFITYNLEKSNIVINY